MDNLSGAGKVAEAEFDDNPPQVFDFVDTRSADELAQLVDTASKLRRTLTADHFEAPAKAVSAASDAKSKDMVIAWSGGKDCALGFTILSKLGYNIVGLFTLIDSKRSVSISAPFSIGAIRLQSTALGIPHSLIDLGETPQKNFKDYFSSLSKSGVKYLGMSYISPIGQRDFVQKLAAEAGIEIIEPLCARESRSLIEENLKNNILSVVIGVDANKLPVSFLGKIVDMQLIAAMKETCPSMDYAGENGEYQTMVIDADSFRRKILIKKVCRLTINNYQYIYITQAISLPKEIKA